MDSRNMFCLEVALLPLLKRSMFSFVNRAKRAKLARQAYDDVVCAVCIMIAMLALNKESELFVEQLKSRKHWEIMCGDITRWT